MVFLVATIGLVVWIAKGRKPTTEQAATSDAPNAPAAPPRRSPAEEAWASLDPLARAINEADQTDPQWRFEELEQRREQVPAEQNSALRVQAAAMKIPSDWPVEKLVGQFSRLAPPMLLPDSEFKQLQGTLQTFAPALREARGLSNFPRGRFHVNWLADLGSTPRPHLDQIDRVSMLLYLDSVFRSHEGEVDEALASCRGMFHAGRSIVDEPHVTSQLNRRGLQYGAVRAVEVVLAKGQPSEQALLLTQRTLEEETRSPWLLIVARAERAYWHRYQMNRADEESRAAPGKQTVSPESRKQGPAWLIQRYTALGQIARLPVEHQYPAIAQWEASVKEGMPLADKFIKQSTRIGQQWFIGQASLRCAETALALERYRRKESRWPASLEALVPELLPAVPLDSFTGKPLGYRKRADGVVVYSVGLDLQDNGGVVEQRAPNLPGTDLGLRLWDVAQRRQPAH